MRSSPPGPVDYGLFAMISGLYGCVFIFISVAVETLPPFTVVASRQLLAASVFLIAAFLMKQSLAGLGQVAPDSGAVGNRIWGLIFLSAVFGNTLPYLFTSWGQQEVEAGLSAILLSTTPLITVILAHFLAKNEQLNRYKIIGVLFGFAGVLWLINPAGIRTIESDFLRQLAIFGSACSFAVNLLIMKSLVYLPRMALIAAISAISFLLALPFSLFFDQPWLLTPSIRSVIAVILLGLLAGGIGNILSFALVARQGAGFNSQTSYVIPLMAMFWAWLFLSEYPDKRAWFALALVLVGLVLVRIGDRKGIVTNAAGISGVVR